MSAAAVVTAVVFALSGCGDNADESEPQPTSAEQQELQDRVDQLEAEASKRDAEAAAERRRRARERRERERRERQERERREREREQAAASPDAGVDPTGSNGGGIVVPDVVGLDHQAAQNALQGEGLYSLDERDCSGEGRLLLFDRNWEVVSTEPPAGTPVSENTTITLCSVKQGEQ